MRFEARDILREIIVMRHPTPETAMSCDLCPQKFTSCVKRKAYSYRSHANYIKRVSRREIRFILNQEYNSIARKSVGNFLKQNVHSPPRALACAFKLATSFRKPLLCHARNRNELRSLPTEIHIVPTTKGVLLPQPRKLHQTNITP